MKKIDSEKLNQSKYFQSSVKIPTCINSEPKFFTCFGKAIQGRVTVVTDLLDSSHDWFMSTFSSRSAAETSSKSDESLSAWTKLNIVIRFTSSSVRPVKL